jgi:hypothetical protein
MRLLTVLIFFTSLTCFASSQLVVVQTISNTEKSFITRKGKLDGVTTGMKGTFTGKDVSVIARAKTVSRDYTVWTLENTQAKVPFERGEIVTYHNTSEYVWTLMPDEVKKKFTKSMLFSPQNALIIRSALSRGLNQSVSEVQAPTTLEIGGYLFEVIYEKEINRNLAWGFGLRLEQEIINVNQASLTTNRQMLMFETTYYLNKMEEFFQGQLYGGLDIGYGFSNTQAPSVSTSGSATILPAVRLGLLLPMNDQYKFMFETALESLRIEEGSDVANQQTTNQINFKYGIGIKRYF